MQRSYHHEILKIALPSIISNVTVPLLGLVDMTIVGHLGSASYIGAIAIGSTIFNMIYWIFAFLRMGTSGITSQSYGANNIKEAGLVLIRSLLTSLSIALLILLCKSPLFEFAMFIMSPEETVRTSATIYFNICIWGAPAILALFSITGWFIGMQNAKYPLYIAVSQNVINIIASLYFVLILKMDVAGVALGTVIAQYFGLILSIILCIRMYIDMKLRIRLNHLDILRYKSLKRFFTVNRDIFFRTLCIVCVTLYFTSAGSKQSNYILAANALLMQYFTLYSYFMDGFAFAGEALSGKYIGAKDIFSLNKVIKSLFLWGGGVAIIFTLIYLVGGNFIMSVLTDEPTVRSVAQKYTYWTVCIHFAGLSAFVWDGIFIGLTATRQMLISMLYAMATFFITYLILEDFMGNHALWLSFILYLFVRGAIQHLLFKNKILPLQK